MPLREKVPQSQRPSKVDVFYQVIERMHGGESAKAVLRELNQQHRGPSGLPYALNVGRVRGGDWPSSGSISAAFTTSPGIRARQSRPLSAP